MPNTPSFFITTPIYYVNARPHIGHAYTTVVADAIARRKRALGFDTWFLTGTDEHGQKIERSAQQAGQTPQEFATAVSGQFRSLWDRMGLTYDDFIRTTEGRHYRGMQKLWSVMQERGFIYKGSYTGQYCVSDELYVDAPPGSPCPDCGRITETVSEENYFFKLSAFERKLLELYEEHPEFIRPESSRNEVIAFVRGGLKDLSASRTSFDWGIPVPGDPGHVIYVWVDALANYITALGYGSDDLEDQQRFARYWPASLQLVGKEIIRFHCIYWPALLMAAGLPLPKAVAANGWLLFEQSKMSKSRGNVVRSETILATLGADALRYFLMREVVFGQDGSFSFDALVQRYNADLANGYGNLTSRVLAMITQYFGGVVPAGDSDPRIVAAARKSSAGVCPALRRTGFFPRPRVPLGPGRCGGRLHHRKGSLEAGRRRGRWPQGINSVYLRRSASYHYRAGLSRPARRWDEDMGATWFGRHCPGRSQECTVGAIGAGHQTRTIRPSFSAGRKGHGQTHAGTGDQQRRH